MTDKQSIADRIGLLYQERKLIDFIVLQSKDRLLFSGEELLQFCKYNPERFQRLVDQDILIKKGGNYLASNSLGNYLRRKDRFSLDSFIQQFNDLLKQAVEGKDASLSEWKECLYQLEEIFLQKAEELSIARKPKELEQFQEQIRELRFNLLDEKLKSILDKETEILYLDLRQVLKELEESMRRIAQRFDPPFNQKIRAIKERKDTARWTHEEGLGEMLKNQCSLFLEPALQIKPRISSSHLEEEEALHTLAKNIR